MGVLKPEEEVILKKYRKLNPQKAVKKAEDQSSQNYSKKKQVKQPV